VQEIRNWQSIAPADALSASLLPPHDIKDLVSTFIDTVQTVTHQLSNIGCPVLKDETGDIIILGWHKSFMPICSALLAQKTQPPLTEIIDAIEAFEASKHVATCAHLEPTISYGDSAMYTSASKRTHASMDPSDFNWGNTACCPNTCDHCRRIGHPATRCFADMPRNVHAAILEAHMCHTNYITVRGHPPIPLLPLSLTMSVCIPHGLYTYPTTSIPLQPPRDNWCSSSISQYSMIRPTWSQPRWMPCNYHHPHRSNVTWPYGTLWWSSDFHNIWKAWY
jgi:hypothetical protein